MSEPRHQVIRAGSRRPEIEALAARGLSARQIADSLGVGFDYAHDYVQLWRSSQRRGPSPVGEGSAEASRKHAKRCMELGGFPTAVRLKGRTVHVYPGRGAA